MTRGITLVLLAVTVLAGAAPCSALADDAGRAAGPRPALAGDADAAGATGQGDLPSRPPADLPLTHWAYPLLERLASRGVLEIDLTTRPVARSAVASVLSRRAKDGNASGRALELTPREAWALERLEAEFLRGEVDRPMFAAREGTASLGLGIRALTEYASTELAASRGDGGVGPASRPRSGRGGEDSGPDVAVDLRYDLWGGVVDRVGFYSEVDVVLGGQEGARSETLSSRARTWRGIAATSELAYVKLETPHTTVALGRRDAAWGRSGSGGLLFSGEAATFDELAARFSAGALSFDALHAFLEYVETGTETDLGADDHVFISAHRMSIAGAAGAVSLSEAVVYSSAIPDPAYLNPLAPFYLSQHNEREDDNVFWSLDFLVRPRPGLDLYGELLVDDLQYERNTGHPDKYGATLGAALFTRAGDVDLDLCAEYSNVRKWTYTHHRVEHRLEQDGSPLGFPLGPDADRLTVGVTAHPAPAWSVGLAHGLSRKGEGTLTDAFEEGESPEPVFPSGVVETTSRTCFDLAYDNLRGLRAFLSMAYVSVTNVMNGFEDDDGWEVHAGIGFRI